MEQKMAPNTRQELQALVSETTQKIASAQNNVEINHIVENLITHVMGTDYASLWVFQKETATLLRARDDQSINEISMLGQHGVLAKCFFTLSGGIFNYLASEKEYLPEVDNPDNIQIKSKIILPIIDDERFLGIVTAYASVRKIKHFTQDDMEILETLVPFLTEVIYLMYPHLKEQKEEVYISERLSERSENLVKNVEAVQQRQQVSEESSQTLNFLANTVHDIRTPANALYGFLELLEEQLKDARLLQYIHNAKESAHFINDLTTSILDRIATQRERNDTKPVTLNPTKFFANIAEIFSANMHNKEITYNIFIDPALPKEATIEEMKLKRVLMNLLNNAYKFTPAGGEVSLLVRYLSKEQKVSLSIQDTGIGIAPEKQEEIFKAFTQAEETTKETYGGTGLGLSICAEYVHDLGGTLQLKSALEQGSTFYFTIPLTVTIDEPMFTPVKNTHLKTGIVISKHNIVSAKNLARYLQAMGLSKTQITTLHPSEQIPEEVTHLICYQSSLNDTLQTQAENRKLPLSVMEETFLSLSSNTSGDMPILSQYGYYANLLHEFIAGEEPLRVLIADDDKINTELIKAILSDAFCHIDTAADGELALSMMQKALQTGSPYQLAYLDKHMPLLSGSEVIDRYRTMEKQAGSSRLFAVSISGDGIKDEKSAYLFDMFVGKPFNKKAIQETLTLAQEVL